MVLVLASLSVAVLPGKPQVSRAIEAWCSQAATNRQKKRDVQRDEDTPVITSNPQVTQTCLYNFIIACPFSTATRGLEIRLCQPRGIKNTEPRSGPAGARADYNSEVSEETHTYVQTPSSLSTFSASKCSLTHKIHGNLSRLLLETRFPWFSRLPSSLFLYQIGSLASSPLPHLSFLTAMLAV